MFKVNQTVRLKVYPENHYNAFARVVEVNKKEGYVVVNNLNMPFVGTIANDRFYFNEVTKA